MKRMDPGRLDWFKERARCHDAVHPIELLNEIAALEDELADWKRRWQDEDDAARHAREALQVEREEWRQEKERLGAEFAQAHADAAEYRRAMHEISTQRDALDGYAETLQELVDVLRPNGETVLEAARRVTAEIAHLKPSGQVAEDKATLAGALTRGEEFTPHNLDALSRLVAKAQGYEEMLGGEKAHNEVLDDLYRILGQRDGEDTLSAAERVVSERNTAVANNAALLEVIDDIAHRSTDTLGGMEAHDRAVRVRQQPHPGAALLEHLRACRDLLTVLRPILDLPFQIVEATVPTAGMDSAPDQVVGTLHISLAKMRKLREAISKIEDQRP